MKHLFVLCMWLMALEAQPAGADGWTIETVAPFGAYFDLAVDASGGPHVIFSNCQAWEVCNPLNPGGAELTYGTKAGSAWTFETISEDPAGDHIVIVLSVGGVPHIAYKDSTSQMHYGYRDPTGWQIEDLYHEVLLRYRASPSLAFNADGDPHIAFIERESVRHAFKQAGVWTDEPVTGSSLDNWSARASIAFDSAGAVHVGSWMYYQSAVLFSRGTSSWTYDLVGGDIGWNPWMVLDRAGAAHFVYHGFNGTSYATDSGGSWSEELIDADGVNISDDIVLDGEGRPFVVYGSAVLVSVNPILYDVTLWLAWRHNNVWDKEIIAAAVAVPAWWMNPRMDIDDSGVVHVLYRDPSTDELRYATRSAPTGVGDMPPKIEPALRIVPNPFGRTTEIIFDLDSADHVTVSVYDVHGRLVRRFAGPSEITGTHRVAWDGRTEKGGKAPSGVYFVRVRTSTRTLTGRAVLTK